MHGCTLASGKHAVRAVRCSNVGLLAAGHICASWIHALARALRWADTACGVCGATNIHTRGAALSLCGGCNRLCTSESMDLAMVE